MNSFLGGKRTQSLRSNVPHRRHSLYREVFDSYEHEVSIDCSSMGLSDLHPIENWCVESYGSLSEFDPKNRWNVSYFDQTNPKSYECLNFHFHSQEDAAHFKLHWV
jgi:hypothetical protein